MSLIRNDASDRVAEGARISVTYRHGLAKSYASLCKAVGRSAMESEIENENASRVLADIVRSERELLDLYQKHANGPVGYQHFYLFGIARRALAQSVAFRQMIGDRNSLVALSITRMQLDTVLRLYALFWVADPEDFATKVFKGTEINKLKAKDGCPLTDQYLKERLAPKNDWIPAVYKETSGYIHFSNRHMKAALELIDRESGHVRLQIGAHDGGKPISYYGEGLRAFRHLNLMIPVAAEDWFSRLKQNGASSSIGAFHGA
jgi:hypothetical protein